MKRRRPLADVEWRIITFLEGYSADLEAPDAYTRLTHGRTPADIRQCDEVFINYQPCTLTREEYYGAVHPLPE